MRGLVRATRRLAKKQSERPLSTLISALVTRSLLTKPNRHTRNRPHSHPSGEGPSPPASIDLPSTRQRRQAGLTPQVRIPRGTRRLLYSRNIRHCANCLGGQEQSDWFSLSATSPSPGFDPSLESDGYIGQESRRRFRWRFVSLCTRHFDLSGTGGGCDESSHSARCAGKSAIIALSVGNS